MDVGRNDGNMLAELAGSGRPSVRHGDNRCATDVPLCAAVPAADSTTALTPAPLAITNSAWRSAPEPASWGNPQGA